MLEETTATPPATSKNPLTVTKLTLAIKDVLENRFPHLWVVGEISNFKRAGSGHWYFSIKDEKSQVRCNMWRSLTGSVRFAPRDGTKVLVRGGLNVYTPRGEYSLIVEHMEELGQGQLRQAFEKLKAKLKAEGLFDQEHKKSPPLMPRKVGIVTSRTGAAIRDILRVLHARFGGVDVLLHPARVQGAGAAEEIACGIETLDKLYDCDVIIAGRGGGSEEDLWPFNEEIVARAIFAATTPIISAVGHEVDFTISDFVADIRAATPSNAAEIAVRSTNEYRQMVEIQRKQMDRVMQHKIMHLRNRVNVSESHPIFVRFRSRVNDHQRRLAELDHRIAKRLATMLNERQLRLLRATQSLRPEALRSRCDLSVQTVKSALVRADHQVRELLNHRRHQLLGLINRLDDLSPLKILGRGYAAVYNAKNKLVRDPANVRFGEVIRVQLAKGELHARVIEKEPEAKQAELF